MSSFRVAITQINIKIGDYDNIFRKIEQSIAIARLKEADILVFPELILSGWPLYDRIKQYEFRLSVKKLLEKCQDISDQLPLLLGTPIWTDDNKIINASVLLHNRQTKVISVKNHFCDNDFYNQSKYFSAGNISDIVSFQIKNKNILAFLGDDIFKFDVKQNWPDFDLIIVQSAWPYVFQLSEQRRDNICQIAKHTNKPIVCVQQVGAQDGCIFEGGSFAIAFNGIIRTSLKEFVEDSYIVELDDLQKEHGTAIYFNMHQPEEKISRALMLGIKDFVVKNGFQYSLLGLSGGIDSALVALLACEAIGNNNVKALYLPSRYNSPESLEDANKLAQRLGISLSVISIDNVYEEILKELHLFFDNQSLDTTEENLQSRLRAVFLMAFANKYHNVLLNTSNKSEVATGYGTLYGDITGAISVLGDIYKTQVYQIAKYLNKIYQVIPERIFLKAPSAELKQNQKDSDTLPEYHILDVILYQYIEQERPIEQIIKIVDAPVEVINKVIYMIEMSEFKRCQAPPIIHVSQKPFGISRKMPITEKKDVFQI